MGGKRTGQPHTLVDDLVVCATPKVFDGRRVVILLDARLNGLPVLELDAAPETVHQGSRHHRLADARVSTGYEETAKHRRPLSAATRASAKLSRVASVSAAFKDRRSRAVPAGTAGGRMARTSNPSACSWSATATVRRLSPIITGTIWVTA